jgi:hypothetical protein
MLFNANGNVVWPTFKQYTDNLKKDFRYDDQIQNATNKLEAA